MRANEQPLSLCQEVRTALNRPEQPWTAVTRPGWQTGISDEDTPVLSYPSSHVSSSKEQRTDQREPEERPPGGVQLLWEEGVQLLGEEGVQEGVQHLGETTES